MKTWGKGRKILVILLLLFVVAQAIRPAKNEGAQSGPKDITTVVAVPDSTMAVLKKSCYDCHSNHTDYPWWDRIAPVSWWITSHVNDGKRSLNFTEFANYTHKKQAHRLDDIAEQVDKHEMPINSYLWMHSDAALSDAQRKMILDWAKSAQKSIPQP